MTHKELVARAEKWLRTRAEFWEHWGKVCRVRKAKCGVVLSELVTSTWEVPDAIGWAFSGTTSILVECKASRADFLSDCKKPFRQRPKLGVGKFRYYLAPEGLIDVNEIPERWGLLVPHRKSARVVWTAAAQEEHNRNYEMRMLWSALRRVQQPCRDN